MPSKLFFHQRILADVVKAYYAHPTAWNEIGWGGRRARAATCAWISTVATPGRPPRPSPAAEDEAYQENLQVGR